MTNLKKQYQVIPLTQGYYSIIDKEDFERVRQYKWHVKKYGGHRRYAARSIIVGGKGKTILMHRFILNLSKGVEADHINRDGLDNRKDNLRICPRSHNMQNKPPSKHNTSGYKGVDKDGNRWRARISIVDGERIVLGYFDNKEEAALAYNRVAKARWGDLAYLNKLEGRE